MGNNISDLQCHNAGHGDGGPSSTPAKIRRISGECHSRTEDSDSDESRLSAGAVSKLGAALSPCKKNHQDIDEKGGCGGSSYHNCKKGGGSSLKSDVVLASWPLKFVIALSNKETEEDCITIKGSKLPYRPKKRAKLIQRTLNAMSPGARPCDLILERYDVRKKSPPKRYREG